MFRVIRVMLLPAAIVLTAPVYGRDDGRYANSPLKSWFESLHSEFGQCCTNADGYIVADPDWDTDGANYRVRIDDEWVEVPGGAVVKQPNRAGWTMVWKHYLDGHPKVRCFMPGSMS